MFNATICSILHYCSSISYNSLFFENTKVLLDEIHRTYAVAIIQGCYDIPYLVSTVLSKIPPLHLRILVHSFIYKLASKHFDPNNTPHDTHSTFLHITPVWDTLFEYEPTPFSPFQFKSLQEIK